MHIPDGFLSLPVVAGTYATSAGGLVVIWKRVWRRFNQQTVPHLAMFAALIFVAQMINIPISGGTSGHLLGGFLAALVLGPAASMFIMFLVLTVQMLLFQDGGVTALGANFLNMGLVGVGASYLFYRLLEKVKPRFFPAGVYQSVSIFVAGWFSVVIGAFFCGVELGLSGLADLSTVVSLMVSVHALIGLLEGTLTLFIFKTIQSIRPDLIYINQKAG